jgi:hypothetical protein
MEEGDTSTAACQKHEISLNIAGITSGNSQANDGEMVKLLREGGDASLAQARIVQGEITKVREGMDANRDEIAKLNSQLELQNSKLDLQNRTLELQNSKLDFQTKMQNLVFALKNYDTNCFNYNPENSQHQVSSKDLVRTILLHLRRGYASPIRSKHGTMSPAYNCRGNGELLKSEQAFRDKLSIQIHELTGVKPRFEFKKEKDEYWISYS